MGFMNPIPLGPFKLEPLCRTVVDSLTDKSESPYTTHLSSDLGGGNITVAGEHWRHICMTNSDRIDLSHGVALCPR